MTVTADRKLAVRSTVNDWIGRTFPEHRSLLAHNQPVGRGDGWAVELVTKRNGAPTVPLGTVLVSDAAAVIGAPDPDGVLDLLAEVSSPQLVPHADCATGDGWTLHHGDGIAAAAELADGSVDLLLTDPPYGISRRYTCETQIPRRPRSSASTPHRSRSRS